MYTDKEVLEVVMGKTYVELYVDPLLEEFSYWIVRVPYPYIHPKVVCESFARLWSCGLPILVIHKIMREILNTYLHTGEWVLGYEYVRPSFLPLEPLKLRAAEILPEIKLKPLPASYEPFWKNIKTKRGRKRR